MPTRVELPAVATKRIHEPIGSSGASSDGLPLDTGLLLICAFATAGLALAFGIATAFPLPGDLAGLFTQAGG